MVSGPKSGISYNLTYDISFPNYIVRVAININEQSVHVNRVSPANTLKKKYNPPFRGKILLNTIKHRRINQMKFVVS